MMFCLFFWCTMHTMEQSSPLTITAENQFIHDHPDTIQAFCDTLIKRVTYHTKKRPEAPISLNVGANMLGYHDSTLDRSIQENALHSLFQGLSQVPVTHLDLYFNSLETVPPALATLSSLIKLDLSHNELKTVPLDLLELPHLEHINLSHNRLTELPGIIKRICPLIITIGTQRYGRIYCEPVYTLDQLPITLMLNPLITIICSLYQFGILHHNMTFSSSEQCEEYEKRYADQIKKCLEKNPQFKRSEPEDL